MTEIVVYGPAAVSAAGLPMSLPPSIIGTIVVVVLGLALLGAFLWQVLFTPVEEERPASYRSALREPPPPERYRVRGFNLFRQPRHR